MRPNVLVVGAGPVGLTLAVELVRYGVSVRVIEKAPSRTTLSKALVVWSRTLELIERMGCATAFVSAGHKCFGARIFANNKEIGHIKFDGLATPYPFALMLPQSETERLLEEQLASYGVAVERGVELESFNETETGVMAVLRDAAGGERMVESTWLAGCDGAHSTVRHGLGMEFGGTTFHTDWILGDVHLENPPHPEEVAIVWHTEGILALFPIAPGRHRILADVGRSQDTTRRPDPDLAEIQHLLDRRGPGGMTASDPTWLSAFRINERKVMNYRGGRVFLAGDAAHVHSPAGGQGMNTGMQDACNLAWKLALVCRGEAGELPLLDSYSIERSRIADEVLKGTGRMSSVALLKGSIQQDIRNHVAALIFGIAPFLEAAANAISELTVAYANSPLNVGGRHGAPPRPGDRAPLRENDVPVGSGRAPRFALFAPPSASATALFAKFPHLLEPEARAPFVSGGIHVVRPDGYVAVATEEWKDVEVFFQVLSARHI